MSNGSDIIIKGGSAEIHFDHSIYEQDPKASHKHQNQNKKIVRVVITGDINFDSGAEKPGGIKCEIKAFCR
ncbi:MAG TPA: hypothetical protein VFD48_00565 [Pyrinomonadaceae bacterium]|nr:hypothetical protein [Pyrinomonadaceae bacterium]